MQLMAPVSLRLSAAVAGQLHQLPHGSRSDYMRAALLDAVATRMPLNPRRGRKGAIVQVPLLLPAELAQALSVFALQNKLSAYAEQAISARLEKEPT